MVVRLGKFRNGCVGVRGWSFNVYDVLTIPCYRFVRFEKEEYTCSAVVPTRGVFVL